MKKRGWWIPLCVVTATIMANAAVGTWKNFTSMKDVRSLARAGGTYWAATGGGLFSWTESTDAYQFFTNSEGLQNIDLTALGIDDDGNVWTGTSTGVIHVYSPSTGTWRYIFDIAGDPIETNKRINSFTMHGDTVLICTSFGLSMFHRGRFQFGDTYKRFGSLPANAKISCSSAIVSQESVWIAISDGLTINRIAVAGLASGNLLPPEAWSVRTVGSSTVVPRVLADWNGSIYAGTSTGLFRYADGSWAEVTGLSGQSIVAVLPTVSSIIACGPGVVSTVDNQNNVQAFGVPFPSQTVGTSVAANAAGQPVVGSSGGGILTYSANWIRHLPNGPNSNQFLSVTVDADGNVWAASGSSNGSGFYRYKGKTWKSFTPETNPAMLINEVYRISTGCDGTVWASTYGRGIVEMPPGVDTVEASHVFGVNVGMVGVPNNPSFVVPSTVACDSHGNLWLSILNAGDKRPLAVRQANGSWTTLPAIVNGVPVAFLMDNPVDRCLAVDANDNLWATVREGGSRGVISFGNRGTLDSTSAFHITSADGLPSDDIKTIVVDRDNNIWVGTDRGIGIILDPNNPKRAGGIASYKPLADLNLVVNTIAVDPLNQKWVGTSEGVIVLSQDGTQQVANYTVRNTGGKLIDNDVKSIAVDPNTGTVYMGTIYGLSSLTTAGALPKVSFEELTLSPNPFLLPNGSQLTIDGLVENSSIKILSIDGKLVRDLTTPGGRIGFWDGMDEEGKYVASGVYLVAAYSEDGRVATGKVAVIRR